MNKLQWHFNPNSDIFFQENALESVVCEMASILSRPQSVKCSGLGDYTHSHCIYAMCVGIECSFWKTTNFNSVISRIWFCFIHSAAWLQCPGKLCLWCEQNVFITYMIWFKINHMCRTVFCIQNYYRWKLQTVAHRHLQTCVWDRLNNKSAKGASKLNSPVCQIICTRSERGVCQWH